MKNSNSFKNSNKNETWNSTHSNVKHLTAAKVINKTSLTPRIWGLWLITGLGFAIDGFDLFIIGVALPLLMKTYPSLDTNPSMVGLLAAAAPIGAIFGAAIFGRLTDVLGRKFILVLNIIIFIVFSFLCAISWSEWSLFVFRFMAGIGIGGEYPVNSAYISEIIPKKYRKQMQIGNFSFQAIGAIAGALSGVIILELIPMAWVWRIMLALPGVFSIILFSFRLKLPESSKWLASQGKTAQASEALCSITGEKIHIDYTHKKQKTKYSDIFSKDYLKITVLTSIPWFLMDIAFYGIGIFTPVILNTLFKTHESNFISKDIFSIKGALFVDMFLLIGIIITILLSKKVGMLKLQIRGFWGMGIGMLVLMASTYIAAPYLSNAIVFLGFILFYLSLNIGPNPMTFLVPAKVFPTNLKATGHGFSAALAKAGAALGVAILPAVESHLGIPALVFGMAIVCFLGAIITHFFIHLIIMDKEFKKYQKILSIKPNRIKHISFKL